MKKNTLLNSSSVQSRLALCAAALAGTAAAIPSAQATVITNNTAIPIPANTAGVYINFVTGQTGTSAGAVPGWDFNPYSSSGVLGFYWSTDLAGSLRGAGVATDATSNLYANLAAGTTVSSSSPFTSAIQGTSANYRGTGTEILGFRFVNESTGTLNFGYLTITTIGSTGFPATITSYRYENNGGAITVAAVPEPSTVALLTVTALTLGAAGVRNWRRQHAA